ncbi:hypothetical protein VFPPC_06832 [Pochonia chlamydosporia 170]|uniref:Uncharacterized protein n=1 Tax=Pochonia chlamydosporia 170 TaxID=1380566 RepID=A0A179F5N1_METCM|nr:hypothetical protein VFPPC_06832 [Pochonia chlamydosporia 170]OAQ60734.1 hypothetical protein VFPPC_06832 [Pochonia chlamydosporia 170]
MPISLRTILVAALTCAATAQPVEDLIDKRGKFNPAVAMATFSDTSCTRGQRDFHQPDGVCYDLPGQGMKIWWLAPGCRVLLGDCSNSVNPDWRYVNPNDCINISNKHKYQVYC